jgi:hypothetical protein
MDRANLGSRIGPRNDDRDPIRPLGRVDFQFNNPHRWLDLEGALHSQVVQTQPGIPGAVFMPFDELKTHHHELPRDRDVIPYCDCPNDAASVQATLLLREKGFMRVWPLAGGIEAWQRYSAVRSQKDQGLTEKETAVA